MRIVIDLQAAQSSSRLRGIGRYSLSLTEAIIRLRGNHEVILVLSGLFPDTIEPLRAHFKALLADDAIRVWYTPAPVSENQPANAWRMEAARCVREAFLEQLEPDIILLCSLFEGYGDNSVTSVRHAKQNTPVAVILFDLIPLLHQDQYLANPSIRAWYHQKIIDLEQAQLLLAISASAKAESTTAKLNIPQTSIINISSASTDNFKQIKQSKATIDAIRARYQLDKAFLMYTGGIDLRKNIEGLIRGYALLAKSIRETHQLAIVCSINPADRVRLMALATEQGIASSEMIFTGYVSEEDLIALYNLCKAFIFPSWHEGFGLPILEAMQCGAPVIGSNISSIPEVIGLDEALFDPHDDAAIAQKITAVLTDEAFRRALITHGTKQAKQFSWDKTAQTALSAMESLHQSRHQSTPHHLPTPTQRPTLAYISPLPPGQSGIAIYSAMLLPALAKHYAIDVILDQPEVSDENLKPYCAMRDIAWFLTHAKTYDRVLYHMGNSTYHTRVFDLIQQVPGVVVLHDFYLSGLLGHLEATIRSSFVWSHALYHTHGYHALATRYHATDLEQVKNQYPCNKAIIDASLGLIVHANESKKLAQHWLGEPLTKTWFHVPHLRPLPENVNKQAARAELKLHENAFIICSFGFLASSKLSMRVLEAWIDSALSKNPNNMLIFVGEASGNYGRKIRALIFSKQLTDRVIITGWVDEALFNQYLSCTDLAIQLRTDSRGETSGAVLAAMAYGVPTIINAHGSLKELPDHAVWMLDDVFSDADLIHAIDTLSQENIKRNHLGHQARNFIQKNHAASTCATGYATAIEASYAGVRPQSNTLMSSVAGISHKPSKTDLLLLAEAISINQTPQRVKQLFIDVSHWSSWRGPQRAEQNQLKILMNNPPQGYRIEPIYTKKTNACYRYARTLTLKWLGCPSHLFNDDPIIAHRGDCYLLFSSRPLKSAQQRFIRHLSLRGVTLYLATPLTDALTEQNIALLDVHLRQYMPEIHWKRQLDPVDE